MLRRLNRRSFLSCVVGSSIVGGGIFARIGGAQAQITDRDPTDPRGRGRGITDRDSGPGADPAGRGRGRGAGASDRDSGANADPAGRGRGGAPAERRCNWTLNGTFEFLQSNNISGEIVLSQNGDRVLGTAYFFSPTMRRRVDGTVQGFVDGTNFSLRIAWFARGPEWTHEDDRPRTTHTYDETGIYEGRIAANGSIEGANYPYNRPRARTTFFMRQRAMCR